MVGVAERFGGRSGEKSALKATAHAQPGAQTLLLYPGSRLPAEGSGSRRAGCRTGHAGVSRIPERESERRLRFGRQEWTQGEGRPVLIRI